MVFVLMKMIEFGCSKINETMYLGCEEYGQTKTWYMEVVL